ncbi:bile acid:sodium symporter family protein [Oceanobacillus piezotolerans]|uniref:Bile acid:sodium symporter family protein n=1 Tax=Oceanobacillus piezotolerans TaxID=2448030 RepID=A0A498DG96_9BACI|nr:bile acid:sodium symporter family protein [Oceanobacillus piezotolerans]RLL43652.1 bile acid:sodium symporter family protein [Oceanobacillus piezotolerans]
MKYMNSLNGLFTNYLAWIVIVVAAVALTLPDSLLWASPYTALFLQIVMFTMGLTMKVSDFAAVFKKPWLVLLVFVMQFGFMPVSAFLLAKAFSLPPEIALGLILVGAVPGGTSSNVITYLANGDVPLSITATSISTLLAPIFTPLVFMFYGGEYLDISFWSMFQSIVQVVLIPIVLGLVINSLFHNHVKKVEGTLPTLSSVAVLLVLGGTVAINQESLIHTGALVFLVVFLHNMSGYAVGYIVGKLIRTNKATTRAMALETGIQNTGLAASLALTHFTPTTALAGAAGTIVHTLFGTIYANLCRKKDIKKAEEVSVPNSLESAS